MNENKRVVVDVRTPQEFMGGNVLGSINIPIHEIMQRIDEIKNLSQPIILCCASGNRSGQVAAYLNSIGIQSENAGCWMDVERTYQMS